MIQLLCIPIFDLTDNHSSYTIMAYVVTEPCIKCKYTNCAAVCPVDAFREGPNFLTIDPLECIDCDACVPECPVDAIYPDDEVPEKWEDYIELNEELAEKWHDRIINETSDPLPDADEWANVENKRQQLIESWELSRNNGSGDQH